MQGAAEDLQRANAELVAAESGALASLAEVEHLRHVQDSMHRCATTCDALGCTLHSLHDRLGRQRTLHQSIQHALFSGRRRAALDDFRSDLLNAKRDVCQIDEAIHCGRDRLEASERAVGDAKERIEATVRAMSSRCGSREPWAGNHGWGICWFPLAAPSRMRRRGLGRVQHMHRSPGH